MRPWVPDEQNRLDSFAPPHPPHHVTALLRKHIPKAADIVAAAKNWPAADMKSMVHDHLRVTTAELEARLRQDWKADVAASDEVQRQILVMADALSEGIIRQFPDKMTQVR